MAQVNYSAALGTTLGAGAGIASGIAAITSVTATTVGIGVASAGIGAAVITLVLLFSKMFGPDPNNVPAAQMEQSFEAAGLNLERLTSIVQSLPSNTITSTTGGPCLISVTEALDGLASLQQALDSYEQQLSQKYGDVKPFKDACANAQTVFSQQAASIQGLSYADPTGAINFQAAARYYIPATTPGWYEESLTQAGQVTTTYLQSIARTVPALLSNAVSSLGSTIENYVGGLLGLAPAAATQGLTAGLQDFISSNESWLILAVLALILVLIL